MRLGRGGPLELAAAVDGGDAAGFGGGAAACDAGAGSEGGAGADEGEPVTEPNQRVRRLPLLALLGCWSVGNGGAPRSRRGVGGAGRWRGSLVADSELVAAACARCSLTLGADFGREGGDGSGPFVRAAAFGDDRIDRAVAARLAGCRDLGIPLSRVRPAAL